MVKKALYIITKGTWGGAQRYVFDLASHLPQGWEAVVASGSEGELSHKCTEHNLRWIHIPGLTRDIGLFSEFRAGTALYRLLKKERPDTVHLNSSKAGGLGALIGRIAHIPTIVFTIHGLPQDEPRSFLSKRCIAVATWITCALSDVVICISHDNAERVRQWPLMKNKVHRIYNGVTPFTPLSRHEARKALTLKEEAFIVGTVAELTRNKGIEYALRAIAQMPQATLVCIGAGEERVPLETLAHALHIHERVQFIEFVENARTYLSAFDILCIPSVKEGVPYVLLEAIHAQVPVVASNLPGIREVVGDNYPLVPAGDISALVIALQTPPPTISFPEHFSLAHMLSATYSLYTPAVTPAQ